MEPGRNAQPAATRLAFSAGIRVSADYALVARRSLSL